MTSVSSTLLKQPSSYVCVIHTVPEVTNMECINLKFMKMKFRNMKFRNMKFRDMKFMVVNSLS